MTLTANPTWRPAPLEVSFSGSAEGSGACSEGTITQYVLSFGDGSADVTSESAPSNVLHTYSSAGNFRATLTATDSRGEIGIASVNITVSVGPGPSGLIAFTSDRDANTEDFLSLDIFVMNADGTGQTNLTNNPGDDLDPAWSDDGTKIAFDSRRDGNAEIYVMDGDGTGQTNLTKNPADDEGPAWSPDGSKIAFDRSGDIWIMNADGTGQALLVSQGVAAAWSPYGTKIAFERLIGWDAQIFVMNADGSGQTRLTNNPADDREPAWSPDGSKIAFSTDRDGNWGEIYVMNADGTGQTRLTNNGVSDESPAWSPDRTKIAFTSRRDGNSEIYVMNADGTVQTSVTNNPASDYGPAWLPHVVAINANDK